MQHIIKLRTIMRRRVVKLCLSVMLFFITGIHISFSQSLISITPNGGKQGLSFPVTITGSGTNWQNSPYGNRVEIIFSGTGITVSSPTIQNATTATAIVTIGPDATPGNHTVHVAYYASYIFQYNVSLIDGFSVADSLIPAISSVTPTTAMQGATGVLMDIYGEDTPWSSTGGDSIQILFSGDGILSRPASALSSTHITVPVTIDSNATISTRSVTVQQYVGGIITHQVTKQNCFTVTSPPPEIKAITPKSGLQATSFPVTITGYGTNWQNSPYGNRVEISFSGSGISVSNPTIKNATTATATVTIEPNATPGSRTVYLSYYANYSYQHSISLINGFSVTDSLFPTITSISPSAAMQGKAGESIDIYGEDTHWSQIGGDSIQVDLDGGGVIVREIVAFSSTHINCLLDVDSNATVSVRNVTVRQYANGIITSQSKKVSGFTITSLPPRLISITPNNGKQGMSFPITITGKGTNWQNSPYGNRVEILFTGAGGISVSNPTIQNATTATATVTISPNATPGVNTFNLIYYSNYSYQYSLSLQNAFTVADSLLPVIIGITPSSATQGTAGVMLDILGEDTPWSTDAGDSIVILFSGGGIVGKTVTALSSTHLTAKADIDSTAAISTRSITVRQYVGGIITHQLTKENCFTVTNPPPQMVAVTPNSKKQGMSFPVTITGRGTYWQNGPYGNRVEISFSGSGIGVTNPAIQNTTTATAYVTIDPNATPGNRTVSLTFYSYNSYQYTISLPNGFTVVDSLFPSIISISPSAATQGTTGVSVDLYGEDTPWSQIGGDSIQVIFDSGGVRAREITVITSSHIHCLVDIDSNAAATSRDVTVRQYVGGIIANQIIKHYGFTITSLPHIVSITPMSGNRGKSFPVTITGGGTNWQSSPYGNRVEVSMSGSGVNVIGSMIQNATTATATVEIAPDAQPGSRSVSLAYFVNFNYQYSITLNNGFTIINAPEPKIFVQKEMINFGMCGIGDTVTGTIELRNGSFDTLVIDSLYTKTGYFIVNQQNGKLESMDDSMIVSILFIPGTFGAFKDTLFIVNNSDTPLLQIPLSGSSPLPFLELPNSLVSFGNVKIHQTSTRTLTIKASPVSNVRIDSLWSNNSAFVIADTVYPIIIHKNDSLMISVSFTPDAAKLYLDTLTIHNNTPQPIVYALLFGTGDPVVGIYREHGGVPSVFSLSQNYPNPFNPSTTVSFGLPEASRVRFSLHDIVGREMGVLIDEFKTPGYYSISIDASRFSSGIYFYKLQTGKNIKVKKMQLLK